jgi:hypothetical protein
LLRHGKIITEMPGSVASGTHCVCTHVYIWTKKLNLEEDAIDESQCEISRNCSYFIWSRVYLSKGVEALSASKSK